jgi:hypothetical protein
MLQQVQHDGRLSGRAVTIIPPIVILAELSRGRESNGTVRPVLRRQPVWIPAVAGMTEAGGSDPFNSCPQCTGLNGENWWRAVLPPGLELQPGTRSQPCATIQSDEAPNDCVAAKPPCWRLPGLPPSTLLTSHHLVLWFRGHGQLHPHPSVSRRSRWSSGRYRPLEPRRRYVTVQHLSDVRGGTSRNSATKRLDPPT